jgi:hypothetical protein
MQGYSPPKSLYISFDLRGLVFFKGIGFLMGNHVWFEWSRKKYMCEVLL